MFGAGNDDDASSDSSLPSRLRCDSLSSSSTSPDNAKASSADDSSDDCTNNIESTAAAAAAPRRGSLLELILQEDAPIISGCSIPRMRQHGSVQEKIIVKDDDDLPYQLSELRFAG